MSRTDADRQENLKTWDLIDLTRASVLALERVAEEAATAANRAHERLTRLEMELED